MASSTGTQEEAQAPAFAIAPKEICDSCHSASGPKFSLSELPRQSDLHRYNIVPTDAEREVAEENLLFAQCEASRLNEEIVRLGGILKVLRNRAEALNHFENEQRSLLSPIRKLPMEILRKIFLEVYVGDRYIFCNDRTAFPRIVTQVSSYWRMVAFSCAHLWSKVHATRYKKKYNSTFGPLIQNCVAYSNELPLHIILGKGCTPDVLGSSCVHALRQCAYRWKAMTISDAELADAIFGSHIPENRSLDQLESLDLTFSSPISLNRAPKLFHLAVANVNGVNCHAEITSTESLWKVSLRRVRNPFSTLIGLPWVQITELYLYHIGWNSASSVDFCTFLGSMKNLERLTMDHVTYPEASRRPITLPHLEELYLHTSEESDILEILVAPALITLNLLCEFDSDEVVEFAARSGFSLNEFKICGMEVDHSWMTPEFNTVETLIWEDPCEIAHGLEWLTNNNAPSPAGIFPQMDCLIISEIENSDEDVEWTVDDIIRMLESRLPPAGEETGFTNGHATSWNYIRDVSISFNEPLSEEDSDRVEDFLKSDVVIRSQVVISISDRDREYITARRMPTYIR